MAIARQPTTNAAAVLFFVAFFLMTLKLGSVTSPSITLRGDELFGSEAFNCIKSFGCKFLAEICRFRCDVPLLMVGDSKRMFCTNSFAIAGIERKSRQKPARIALTANFVYFTVKSGYIPISPIKVLYCKPYFYI